MRAFTFQRVVSKLSTNQLKLPASQLPTSFKLATKQLQAGRYQKLLLETIFVYCILLPKITKVNIENHKTSLKKSYFRQKIKKSASSYPLMSGKLRQASILVGIFMSIDKCIMDVLPILFVSFYLDRQKVSYIHAKYFILALSVVHYWQTLSHFSGKVSTKVPYPFNKIISQMMPLTINGFLIRLQQESRDKVYSVDLP